VLFQSFRFFDTPALYRSYCILPYFIVTAFTHTPIPKKRHKYCKHAKAIPVKPLWRGAVPFGCVLTFGQKCRLLPLTSSHLPLAASSVRVKWLSGLDESVPFPGHLSFVPNVTRSGIGGKFQLLLGLESVILSASHAYALKADQKEYYNAIY
jgi:hypothetical protein